MVIFKIFLNILLVFQSIRQNGNRQFGIRQMDLANWETAKWDSAILDITVDQFQQCTCIKEVCMSQPEFEL